VPSSRGNAAATFREDDVAIPTIIKWTLRDGSLGEMTHE
jgi:hypothetical protein